MNPATVAFTLLVILSSSLLENADAQPPNSYDIIRSMGSLTAALGNLSRVVENLQNRVENQGTLLNRVIVTNQEIQVTVSDNLVTKEELQTLSRNLETKADGQTTLLDTLVTKVDMQGTLLDTVAATNKDVQRQAIQLDNLKAGAEIQETLLSNMEAQAKMQSTALKKLKASVDLQTTTSNNLVTKEELQATLLKIVQSNVTAVGAELKTLSEDFHKSIRPKETVDGIIAGTSHGVFVIPLGSGEQRKIFSRYTYGVAFDWNTRKVYWIDLIDGIYRANLDGTSMELLISDNSTLVGLAVDHVTGNFYYGVQSPRTEIRVCGRSGQKCAVIASGNQTVGNDIYDIALYPSEGIMFWSNYNQNKIVRADMNGGNARVIISEDIQGICVDETSERLYGSQDHKRIITSYDLNGNDRKVLLSRRLDPRDVAADGDTVYFGNDDNKSVYSLTPNGQLALIANTIGWVRHIALYGRKKVPSRRNPCHSSACPNVCVLTRDSYTCL